MPRKNTKQEDLQAEKHFTDLVNMRIEATKKWTGYLRFMTVAQTKALLRHCYSGGHGVLGFMIAEKIEAIAAYTEINRQIDLDQKKKKRK